MTKAEHSARCKAARARGGYDWDNEPRLGRMSDVELARAVKRQVKHVRSARVKRGIPPAPRSGAGELDPVIAEEHAYQTYLDDQDERRRFAKEYYE